MPTTFEQLAQLPDFADDRLIETINIPPYVTGRPAQLGIFRDVTIPTTYVLIGIQDGELTIIPARERGGESNLNMRNDIKGTMITIPHFPLDDTITPADLQNLLRYGESHALQTLVGVYNDKLELMRSKHDLTHSHLDWGALNGLVIDAEGKVLLDVYDTFDVVQTEVPFDLGNIATDVAQKNREAKAVLRRELRGVPSTGARVLAGANFFDTYVKHPKVLEAMKYYRDADGKNPSRDAVEETFTFAGLTLERIDEDYPVRLTDGTIERRAAVPADDAILVPLGTPYFKRYVAPPDSIHLANRAPDAAEKVFVSTDELPHGKGQEIHTESNVLPVCLRPQVLLKLTMAAA